MPQFGKGSLDKLNTCHTDIQKVMHKAIKYIDFTILYGHRGEEEQTEIYAQGRTKPGQIVTHTPWPKSEHNKFPSTAVDVAPFPIDWNDLARFDYLAGRIIQIADEMLEAGEISHKLIWGHDWDGDNELKDTKFIDRPHFQLKKP
jgi:peptidoglycan L-alanyl-D-glutamate endopeptidase CwlK